MSTVPTAALLPHHLQMLRSAGISDDIIAARGYRTIPRPTAGDARGRQELESHGISRKITSEDTCYPGLLIPVYRATGEQISVQFRPGKPPRDAKTGKPRKYVMPAGRPPALDVHPFNRDHIIDPTVPLWVTEGIKKGDALTSAGACVVTLSGVFNWRSGLGTLGDWEDIPLSGRPVFVCFDADAATSPNVARAMQRLGKWLQSKGGKPRFIVTPDTAAGRELGGKAGADDFLAAGGTLAELVAVATTRPPEVATIVAGLNDAEVAGDLAAELDGRYCWSAGFGWMRWDGRRWERAPDPDVHERARQWVLMQHADTCGKARETPSASVTELIKAWHRYLGRSRLEAIVSLARGILLADPAGFDADPDLLNCANGVVDLRTGDLMPHDPGLLMTKLTPVSYHPGAEHPDWKAALEAVPAGIRDWYQVRLGQAITGHMTPDDMMLVQAGSGENGKTTLMAGMVAASGDYFHDVPHRALLADASAHPTELADFRGVRLAVLEETPEERRLAVTRLKLLVGTLQITARHICRDSFTFGATHTLVINTNYTPVVSETDHGTWRRLALVRFPYRWLKPGQEPRSDMDRAGDPGLRDRMKTGAEGQHEAVLAWLVAGAIRWYQADRVMPALPQRVQDDTRAWRADSDLVLAFWDENLIGDRESNIAVTDLHGAFNQWLVSRGHKNWSDKTFGARFGEHEFTVGNRVTQDRTRERQAASRPPEHLESSWTGDHPHLAERYRAWLGVRFRTEEDDKEEMLPENSDLREQPFGTAGTADLAVPMREAFLASARSAVPAVPEIIPRNSPGRKVRRRKHPVEPVPRPSGIHPGSPWIIP